MQQISPNARKVLERLAAGHPFRSRASTEPLQELQAADLATCARDGAWRVTDSGRSWLARQAAAGDPILNRYLAQHVDIAEAAVVQSGGRARVLVDTAESPLAWLARRKGRDGMPLISPEQFLAGERLRAEFTRAQMMPRVTANWDAAVAGRNRGGSSPAQIADTVIAARQRLRLALDAAGPEFAGLLVDVCCFLKRLEDVERERHWPARSAKVVLQLGLDRLARHYGLAAEACGPAHGKVRTWLSDDAEFVVEGG